MSYIVFSPALGAYSPNHVLCSMRARVSSRINGLVVVICELGIFMAPFSVIAYLPLFFFGGLMLWIGYEILKVAQFRAASTAYGILPCVITNLTVQLSGAHATLAPPHAGLAGVFLPADDAL